VFPGTRPLAPPLSSKELHEGERETNDCAATAVLVETTGPERTSFLLILYGALIGLGVTLAVESGLLAVRWRGTPP